MQAEKLCNEIFRQMNPDFDESVVRTIFTWNPLAHLESLEISQASNLSIHTVNLIVGQCPRLKRIGTISKWGKISKEEEENLRIEVKARNYDLCFDGDTIVWNPVLFELLFTQESFIVVCFITKVVEMRS